MQLDPFNHRQSITRLCFNRTSKPRPDLLQVDMIDYKIKGLPACISKCFERKYKERERGGGGEREG